MFKARLVRFARYLFACGTFCLFLWPRPAAADATYAYTGNPFNSFSGLTCPPDCAISASFTVPSPLGDSFNASVTPSSWTFTDGNFTLSSGQPGVSFLFDITTNSTGAIVFWTTHATTGFSGVALSTDSVSNGFEDDAVAIEPCGPGCTRADTFGDPGTWTMSVTSTTPEPTSLLLLGTGLLGLGQLVRRRFAMRLTRRRSF